MNNFLIKCKENYKDVTLIEKALNISQEINEKRLSGDYYYEHNQRVAEILVKNKASPEIVVVGLLSHILKYKPESYIKKEFSIEILNLLKSLQQIKKLKKDNEHINPDHLRKILLTTIEDLRVIIVKLAGKIDNLRTINVFERKKQKEMAEEVLNFYAPLASRLGLNNIKVELEDLAFKIINPRRYNEIKKFIKESEEERQNLITKVIKEIKDNCNLDIIKIKGRPKHAYSIYKKITHRKVKLTDQYDHLGIRIIVNNVKDCYNMLGFLHRYFEPMDRLKDYITNPKPNMYQSIHTTVLLNKTKRLEIQIRTEEMDEFAEEGLAAHWRYKGLNSDRNFEKKVSWLKDVLSLEKEVTDKEILETAKIDIFGDTIYCYTPKGDLKELPQGASLLDFAFQVHELVGSKAVGGRVNGKFVNLKHKLNQGDIVEIVTNKNQRPRRGWLKFVKSAKTKQKIRKHLKKYESLPALHYHKIKIEKADQSSTLTYSEDFPNLTCNLAKCCSPLPPEEVIGIYTKNKIISVHKKDCKQALKEQDRWIPIYWKDQFNEKISFTVKAKERSGILADLLHTIATAGFEVKEAKAKLINSNTVDCTFSIIPQSLDNITNMINRIKKVKGILKIDFT
jgi:GTP diphosphokinase / guanosine-3',5'-bis(diphosphate) 3'-diphosphatase